VALEEILVLLNKEETPRLRLAFLAVTTQGASAIVQIVPLFLEHRELRGQKSDEFLVDEQRHNK
jgi:hypothetical protein